MLVRAQTEGMGSAGTWCGTNKTGHSHGKLRLILMPNLGLGPLLHCKHWMTGEQINQFQSWHLPPPRCRHMTWIFKNCHTTILSRWVCTPLALFTCLIHRAGTSCGCIEAEDLKGVPSLCSTTCIQLKTSLDIAESLRTLSNWGGTIAMCRSYLHGTSKTFPLQFE